MRDKIEANKVWEWKHRLWFREEDAAPLFLLVQVYLDEDNGIEITYLSLSGYKEAINELCSEIGEQRDNMRDRPWLCEREAEDAYGRGDTEESSRLSEMAEDTYERNNGDDAAWRRMQKWIEEV